MVSPTFEVSRGPARLVGMQRVSIHILRGVSEASCICLGVTVLSVCFVRLGLCESLELLMRLADSWVLFSLRTHELVHVLEAYQPPYSFKQRKGAERELVQWL